MFLLLSLFLLMTPLMAESTLCACQESQLSNETMLKEVVDELYEIGAIQFGSFTLKSGLQSSYYIDLRKAITRPQLLSRMADLMWEKVSCLESDLICGAPFAALALSTAISLRHDKPMIMARKEVKNHGTRQSIEGIFSVGDKVVIIEDVLVTGISIVETVKTLSEAGLIVTDAVVFLDREQGGLSHLASMNIRVHSVLNISQLSSLIGLRVNP